MVWAATMMVLVLEMVCVGLWVFVCVSLVLFFSGCGGVAGVVMCMNSGGSVGVSFDY